MDNFHKIVTWLNSEYTDLPGYPHLAGFSRIFLALPHPAVIYEVRLPSRIFWNMLQFFPNIISIFIYLIFNNLIIIIFSETHSKEVIFSLCFPPWPVLLPDRWSIDSHIQIVWTIKTTLSRKTGKRVFI